MRSLPQECFGRCRSLRSLLLLPTTTYTTTTKQISNIFTTSVFMCLCVSDWACVSVRANCACMMCSLIFCSSARRTMLHYKLQLCTTSNGGGYDIDLGDPDQVRLFMQPCIERPMFLFYSKLFFLGKSINGACFSSGEQTTCLFFSKPWQFFIFMQDQG